MQAWVIHVPDIPRFQLPASFVYGCHLYLSFDQDEIFSSIKFINLIFNMAFTDLTIEETSNRIVKRLGVLVFLQHALGVVSALGIASSTYLVALGPRDAIAVVGEVLVLAGVYNLE